MKVSGKIVLFSDKKQMLSIDINKTTDVVGLLSFEQISINYNPLSACVFLYSNNDDGRINTHIKFKGLVLGGLNSNVSLVNATGGMADLLCF